MSRNTQRNLANALRRLMERKDLDKITVQELADEAGVNKKTFYYHFHGISDLIGWMYASEFYATIDAEGVTRENWGELVTACAGRIWKDRACISAIYRSGYAADFRQAVVRMFDRATEKYIRATVAAYETENGVSLGLTPVQVSYIVSYHSMALLGVLERWFARGMSEPAEEFVTLVKMINILSDDSLYKAFDRLKNRKT